MSVNSPDESSTVKSQTKRKRIWNANHDECDDEEPTLKRKGHARNQGKLSVFMGLPIDILSEITSHLRPIDILYLSRVSQHFRELFNPYTCRHIWTAARRNLLRLPECPTDLNEAQYASLMFEHHCQACGSPRAHISDFALRRRTCKRCYDALTRPRKKLHCEVPTSWRARSDEIDVFFTMVPYSTYSRARTSSLQRYDSREVTAVSQQYRKVIGTRKPDLMEKFIQERRNIAWRLTQTGLNMHRWQASLREDQKGADEKIGRNREAAIKKRLVEVGWTLEEVNATSWGDMVKSMRQPRPLTDRIWKQLYPNLEKCLIAANFKARYLEFKKVWRPVVEKFVPPEQRVFIPNALEAQELPSIDTLLRRDKARTRIDQAVVEAVVAEALKESEPHQGMVKRSLLRIIYDAQHMSTSTKVTNVDDIQIDDPTLYHAMHRFKCGACPTGRRQSSMHILDLYGIYDHIVRVHGNSAREFRWADFYICYVDAGARVIKELVKIVNASETLTLEEARRFESKLKCGCGSPDADGKLFGISSLMQHVVDENYFYEDIKSRLQEVVHKNMTEEVFKLQDDDHETSKLQSLISFVPDGKDLEPSSDRDTPPEETNFKAVICHPCRMMTFLCVTTRLTSQKAVEYHLKAKHGLEVKDQYVWSGS